MTDINHLRQMLNGLQTQIANISALSGQLKPDVTYNVTSAPVFVPGHGYTDIESIIKNAVKDEFDRRKTECAIVPTISTLPEQTISTIQHGVMHSTEDLNSINAVTSLPAVPITDQDHTKTTDTISHPTTDLLTHFNQKDEQPMYDILLKEFLNKLRTSVGDGLNQEQQIWISSNIFSLPDFFKTPKGKETINVLYTSFKNYTEGK